MPSTVEDRITARHRNNIVGWWVCTQVVECVTTHEMCVLGRDAIRLLLWLHHSSVYNCACGTFGVITMHRVQFGECVCWAARR